MKTWAMRVKKLYTGEKGKSRDRAVIVIRDGTILDVVDQEDAGLLADHSPDFILDYSDHYASPGLIDVHVHLMFPGDGSSVESSMALSAQERTLLASTNASAALARGVTTLRDCGAADNIALTLRDFQARMDELGPDIVAAGMPLTSSCGHCHYMGGAADGVEEIIRLIRQQRLQGIDYLKIMGCAGATKGVRQGLTFTQQELTAAVDEAHRLGLSVTVHAAEIDAVRAAVAAGVDRIEHAYFTDYNGSVIDKDERLAEAILEKGIMLCHTLPVITSSVEAMREELKKQKDPALDASMRYYEEFQRKVEEVFRFHLAKGIPFAAGSDAGWRSVSFADGMLQGMEIMERSGVAPVDVIHAATASAARYVERPHDLGHLLPGYRADLVLLSDDPGKTVSAYRNSPLVFKKGVQVAQSEKTSQ